MKAYLLISLVWMAGCFGPSIASIHGLEGEKDEVQFRFGPIGAEWERVEVGEEDLAYLHRQSGGTVGLQATCDRQYEDAPLRSLTRHLWIGMTELKQTGQKEIRLAGRDALDMTVEAKLDGVPLKMRSVVLKKDGCIFDFVLTLPRPEGNWDRLQPDFEAFYNGFKGPIRDR